MSVHIRKNPYPLLLFLQFALQTADLGLAEVIRDSLDNLAIRFQLRYLLLQIANPVKVVSTTNSLTFIRLVNIIMILLVSTESFSQQTFLQLTRSLARCLFRVFTLKLDIFSVQG